MASLWRPKMSLYRAKKLDIGCFVNTKIIRDHTKRQVYEAHEAERCVTLLPSCPDVPLENSATPWAVEELFVAD